MPKSALGEQERARGRLLGSRLREARVASGLSARAVSDDSTVPLDTVRAIEAGRIANPGFFTVVALARVVEMSLDTLAEG